MRRIVPVILTLMLVGMVFASDETVGRHMAVRALGKRAASGDAKAIYDLAMLHDRGYDTVAVDSARSTMLYRLSAEKGYAPAQSYLGYRYFKGEAVRQDVDSALYWFAKAAGSGDARAANNLGYLLAEGDVVARDYPQAFHWLSVAADAGLPEAESQLADLYRGGLGTEADTLKAAGLYMKAARGGLQDAEMKLVAMMREKWRSLPADSVVSLGRRYYTGGAPYAGVALFGMAADNDSPEAYALLGDAYSKGQGVGYDHDRAVGLFLRAALKGNASAQFVIAELLDIFPDALSRDEFKNLIEMCFPQGGIPKDFFVPSYWYELAEKGGVKDAASAARMLLGR